jgi:drug/metabolite transporter (DMT)-like permease
MGIDLGFTQPEVYGAATIGLLVASVATYPIRTVIDRGHGRTVTTLGSGLAGLLLLAWSQIASLWALYPLLAGIGLAQAMTLYEPAFAVVARRYDSEARRGITALTLWGGFASTVFVLVIQFLLVVEIAPVEHRKTDEQQRTDDTEDPVRLRFERRIVL